MVGSSKILTVSYGTFSCTLEGFDQPFETMKSIAEYFRDLAADDRYFGAEPPQPDMQMLHQIAEREVRRRVETTVQKNGVVLRQTADALVGNAPPAPPERPVIRGDDDRRPPTPKADPADNTPFDVDIDGDSVAAKLSRIRAVVARARANRTADTAFVEDEPVEAYLPGTPTPDEASAPISDDIDDFATETAPTDDSEPPVSLAAMMMADEADAAEEAARVAEEAEQAAEQARVAEQAAERARVAEEAEQAAEQARVAEQAAEQARIAEEAERAAAVAVAASVVPQNPIARVIKLKRTEFEAALAAGDIEEVEDDDDLDDDMVAEIEVDGDEEPTLGEAETALDHMFGDEEPTTGTGSEDDDTALADDDMAETIAAALGQGDTDEDDENVFAESAFGTPGAAYDTDEADDMLTEGIRDLIGQTSLDQDDEAELAAELAAVEREAAAATAAAEAARAKARYRDLDGADEAEPEETSAEENDEQALNRLLDETNTKLSETEGSRRRSAIAHLKAAVAATKADRLLKGNHKEPVEDESLNRYRDDLAQVVRPRRPVAGTGTGYGVADAAPRERPADPLAARPAPLVLVSAQRIDKPAEPAEASPIVRPRRVSATRMAAVEEKAAPATTDAISFADFAEARGATELPDVLEAAMAYATQIEGQNELSRPQIMRKAATLHPDLTTSREKGLQSFGQLLRSGRIRKVGLGQFALSETPERRQNRA